MSSRFLRRCSNFTKEGQLLMNTAAFFPSYLHLRCGNKKAAFLAWCDFSKRSFPRTMNKWLPRAKLHRCSPLSSSA